MSSCTVEGLEIKGIYILHMLHYTIHLREGFKGPTSTFCTLYTTLYIDKGTLRGQHLHFAHATLHDTRHLKESFKGTTFTFCSYTRLYFTHKREF